MVDIDNGSLTSPPPLVLVAHDQEWLSRSIESILGPSGFAVVHAHTGRQALELARKARPDALIIDEGMPDISGIEVCRLLRADARFSASTPVMMTSAAAPSRTDRLTAYKSGVWEYWSQPLDSDALILKLWNYVRSKRELDRCHDESLIDEATGLYNVRGLARRAQELGAEAARRRAPLACIAISPAESEGLPELASSVADEGAATVAHQLGEVLRRISRVSDAVGRLGQSEFAVIAPATEAQGAIRLIERMCQSIEAQPVTTDAGDRTLRLNAGYSAVPDFAESDVDAVELLLRAATALRHTRAKDPQQRISAFSDIPIPNIH